MKNQLIGKDPDAWNNWGQEKGMAEYMMVHCHHQLNGRESEQTPGDSEGQGDLVCCRPRGHKESDTTERWNNNNSMRAHTRTHTHVHFRVYV